MAAFKTLFGLDLVTPLAVRIVTPHRADISEAGNLIADNNAWLTWEIECLTEPTASLQAQYAALQRVMRHRYSEFEVTLPLDDEASRTVLTGNITQATAGGRTVRLSKNKTRTALNAGLSEHSLWATHSDGDGRALLNAIVGQSGLDTFLARPGPAAGQTLTVTGTPTFLATFRELGRVRVAMGQTGFAQTAFTLRAVTV